MKTDVVKLVIFQLGADLFGADIFSVERVRELSALVRRACEEVGRDPATLPIASIAAR